MPLKTRIGNAKILVVVHADLGSFVLPTYTIFDVYRKITMWPYSIKKLADQDVWVVQRSIFWIKKVYKCWHYFHRPDGAITGRCYQPLRFTSDADALLEANKLNHNRRSRVIEAHYKQKRVLYLLRYEDKSLEDA